MNVFAQRCVAFVFNIHLVTRHTRSYTHARAGEMYGRERKYDVLYGIQEQEKKKLHPYARVHGGLVHAARNFIQLQNDDARTTAKTGAAAVRTQPATTRA